MINTAFQKYPAYKDSGVEWLGEIPHHWEPLSNKNIFKLKKNQVGKKSADYVLLSLTLKGIIQRVIEDGGKFPAEFDTYQEVKKGDFVFCLFDVEETPRCVGLSEFEGMITGAYTVMEVKSNFDKSFLYYFYLNLDSSKRLKPLYTGLRNTISKDNFLSFKTFIPPLLEQTAIANFLDDKTAKIDKAIAQKEKLIELLKERKQIIIQDLVTGKKVWNEAQQAWTNPSKTKDSGVEWIGEIPEDWEVKKVKHIAEDFMYGTSVDCNETSKGTPVLRIPNVGDKKVVFENLKYTNLSQEETRKYTLQNNDILIIRTNGNPELVGKSCLFISDSIYMYASYLIRIRPKRNIIPSFFIQVLNSDSVRKSLTFSAKTSVGNYNLNTQSLGDCYLAYPPLREQNGILKNIEAQSAKIDKAIILQEQQIEKLKEYKSVLVDAAVTGKIKVG